MGASENHQTTATEHQNVTRDQNVGRFPELTPVHRVFPDPIPGAGDITPRSEWTSSSTASIRRRANGEVTPDGEAAIFAMTDGFEASETSMSVGSAEADTTGVLKGLGKVGCESPIPQIVCCFSKMGVTGRTPLEEAEEPRTHGFRGE